MCLCVDRYFATFRDNSSVPSSRVKQPSSRSAWPLKMGLMAFPETSVTINLRDLNPRRTMTSILSVNDMREKNYVLLWMFIRTQNTLCLWENCKASVMLRRWYIDLPLGFIRLSPISFIKVIFFPIMWCISFVSDNETCISVLWVRPAPSAVRISCRSLFKLKSALWKRNTKENKSIGVSRDIAVICNK